MNKWLYGVSALAQQWFQAAAQALRFACQGFPDSIPTPITRPTRGSEAAHTGLKGRTIKCSFSSAWAMATSLTPGANSTHRLMALLGGETERT